MFIFPLRGGRTGEDGVNESGEGGGEGGERKREQRGVFRTLIIKGGKERGKETIEKCRTKSRGFHCVEI